MFTIRLRTYRFGIPFLAVILMTSHAWAVNYPQVSQMTAAGGTVWGIVTDKKDDFVMLKVDGQEEPIKYVVPSNANKQLVAVLKSIFTVARVQLTYTNKGDVHQLVSIKRDMSTPKGIVTGEVLSVHDFWVEVKPKNGVPDGYSPGGPNWKTMQGRLQTLKKGDIVTIKFYSDFERKRIDTLQVVGK